MKKWIYTLICLGYLTPSYATDHASFLVTGQDLQEMSYFDHILETPNFFTRVYPENLNPNLVLVPRTNSGFFFGLQGFHQRPYDNQLDYVIQDPALSTILVSPGSTIHSLDPDYEFGYGAYLGYVHPYTGRDIRLEVFNFSGNADDATSATGGGTLWIPNSLYDATVRADHARAHLDTDIEQAKLMTGEHLFGGTRFHLHPSMGAKYAAINRELDSHFTNAVDPFTDFIGNSHVEEKSRFSGVGPAVQVDGQYFFTPHFGLTGHLTNAILIGSIRSENRYTDDQDPPRSAAIDLNSTDRAVPNVDGQLGLVYHYPFCGRHTSLDIEIGYEFNHFFNAVDTYRSTGLSFVSPFHVKHVHDLTLDGPYFSIGVSGISCPNDVVIDPMLVTVPRLEGGFIFGVGAGYFRVQHNQLDYAILDPTAFSFSGSGSPVPTLNGTLKNVEVDNAYGLMLTLGYIFRDSPYDVQAHYREVTANESATAIAPPEGVIWTILNTPLFDPFNTRAFAREARARVRFNFHDGNVEFAQTINADSLLWLRVFGGVQFASINSNLHTTYHRLQVIDIPTAIFPEENIVQNSDFTGIGPRLGFDMTLPVAGFALSSQLAGGFLLGSIDSSYKDTFPQSEPDEEGLVAPGGELGTRVDSETQTSPFMALKLGLSYGFNFFMRTHWTLDFGYMATHYFNAATTFRHATNSAAVFVKQVHDVTIDGPYLNLTVFGFGGCPPDCVAREPYTAYAPILRGGFEFAAEGIYLRPNATNLDYGIDDPTPELIPPFLPVSPINPSQHSHMRVLSPDYEFAYRLHFGYIFQLSANDISVNFVDLNGSASETTVAPPGGVIWTITNGNFNSSPFDTMTPVFFPLFANKATITADFTWQSGNLELGRRLKFYQLMARFFTGLAYARIIEDIDITYSDGLSNGSVASPITAIPISSDVITQQNSFYGIGPRFGIAGDLALGCGFSLIGQIGTDLLVGNIDTGLTETSSAGFSTALNPDKRTRLAPAVDAKLGFAYTVPLRDCAQIGFEIGYQYNHYFNVKDSLRFTDNFSSFIKQDQDISFDGPYVRIQVNFDYRRTCWECNGT